MVPRVMAQVGHAVAQVVHGPAGNPPSAGTGPILVDIAKYPATNIQNAAQGVRLLALAADVQPARPNGEEQPANYQQRDAARRPVPKNGISKIQCRKAPGRIDPPEGTSLL